MKNYTTEIDYHRSCSEVCLLLGKFGARAVMLEYENKIPISLSFQLDLNVRVIQYRLPCNWNGILEVLKKNKRAEKTEEQAIRVGWRCIKDWVEAQLAFVESEMVQLHQVFLPYAVDDNNRTVSENFETKLLGK